jgi:hypothetical protein
VASRPARANPAATHMAVAVRWPTLPCVATSVADTMATPSAEPHCRVAVSSALAVPSDRVATGPRVPARVEAT